MSSYRELKGMADDLLRQAEVARKAEFGAAISEIKATMATYGITLADLKVGAKAAKRNKQKVAVTTRVSKGRKPKASKSRRPAAIKYRLPGSDETWSGRGRLPKWLVAELDKGRAREEFLVVAASS